MKNYSIVSMIACIAMAAVVSCQKVSQIPSPDSTPNYVTLTCAYPETQFGDTKVSIDETGKTQWEVGDKLVIFGNVSSSGSEKVVHEITASEITNPKVAVFTVDVSGLVKGSDQSHDFNVSYPYTGGQFYWQNDYSAGRARFQNTNLPLMAGYVSDDKTSIVLNPVTSVILFKVNGDFDSYLFTGRNGDEVVGYSELAVEMNSSDAPKYRQKYGNGGTSGPLTSITGVVTGDATTLNTVYLPVNNPDTERGANLLSLPNGFTIYFLKGGEIKKYISSGAAVTLAPGHGINLGLLPSEKMHDYVAPAEHNSSIDKTSATDLSASGSANCYIVNAADAGNAGKVFTFKAYRGNSSTSVGTIGSVEVLWETYNNAETVTANSVIAEVDYDKQTANDYYEIVFKMPATLHAGNALIAAKNQGGDILWSWHIWVPDGMHADITDVTVFGSKPIMSRNLGALVDAPASGVATVESYGLFYQWGRKDPFPGMDAVSHNGIAKVSGLTMTSVDGTLTVQESISNPTHFAKSANDKDWVTDGGQDNSLWNSSKTIYDPCPPGYLVPTRNTEAHYWSGTKLNELSSSDCFADNGATYGSYVIGTGTLVVFPYTGYIQMGYGDHYKSGNRTYIWSSYASSYQGNVDVAYTVYAGRVGDSSNAYKRTEIGKNLGASVRCVAE